MAHDQSVHRRTGVKNTRRTHPSRSNGRSQQLTRRSGPTGSIAPHLAVLARLAAEYLGLELAEARTADYDAIRHIPSGLEHIMFNDAKRKRTRKINDTGYQ